MTASGQQLNCKFIMYINPDKNSAREIYLKKKIQQANSSAWLNALYLYSKGCLGWISLIRF